MSIENELDAYISGFHLDALSSGVPLNVDLDTTLTVVAGNLYRLFARNLTRYETATPATSWRHFLDDTGTLRVTEHGVTCAVWRSVGEMGVDHGPLPAYCGRESAAWYPSV